jgi:ADP-ribose pyrophosphatase YjhB (NUDIX family)
LSEEDAMSRRDYYKDPAAPTPTTVKPATSAIVVNEQSEILLHHRTDNNSWGLPGGTMEAGESIAQCLVREVKEETGLDVEPEYLVGLYSDPEHVVAYSDGEVRQQFSMCFYCKLQGGEIKVSDESFEVRFVAFKDIKNFDIHPSIRRRIQHYIEQREQPYFS